MKSNNGYLSLAIAAIVAVGRLRDERTTGLRARHRSRVFDGSRQGRSGKSKGVLQLPWELGGGMAANGGST
jgi:hypothetical protein